MKKITAIVLAVVMILSVVLSVSAESTALTYEGENGFTATKISHPGTGVGEVDGLIEFNGENDRGQNYSWSSVGYGDYVYVGTCFGAIYQTLRIIAMEKGMDFSELKLVVDCLYNGTLYTGDEGDTGVTQNRSFIVKINTKTYETEIVLGPEKNGGYRAATKFNNKLYFAATGAQPKIIEIDPENGDAIQDVCYSERPQSASISTGIRGLTVYKDMLVATMIGNNGAYMVASENPSAGPDSFKTICTQEDLLDYPAYHYMDSIFGGSIWDIIEYNGKLYITVVTGKNGNKQAFALFSGEMDENGEWSFDLIAGNEADGAEYPFGLGSDRSGAANLMTYDGYLYIGGYNDPMLALPEVLNGSFETLYKDLSSPVCLWRLDENDNIEMVAGEANEVFPEGPIGNMGAGFGSNMNQYVWRMENYNGDLYLGTLDLCGLLHPIQQFTNGDILKMSKEEWISQINYIQQVIEMFYSKNSKKDIAATGANINVASLEENLETLEDMSENFDEVTTTAEKEKFYELLMEVKEQYLTIRDYLETETKKRIDAFFANERVQNFYYAIQCCKYLSKGERGFDLFVSEDGVNFDVITRNGMGDPNNHGCRVFAITDSGLCVGTANPFFGTQVWLLDDNKPLYGDVDQNGEVTIFDATELQRYIAQYRDLDDAEFMLGDVNFDGDVNVFDVTEIQRYIAGYFTNF